jgi:hypothetical protein
MSSVKEESKASDEPLILIFKDGSSDSDSSAVIADSSVAAALAPDSSSGFQTAISDSIPFSNSDSILFHDKGGFGSQISPFFKMEECDEFVGEDDTCVSFLIQEQAPSFAWCYGADNWS